MTAMCFDSNILIDALHGRPEARLELEASERRVISIVTWIEVLAGCRSSEEAKRARALLDGFEVVPLDLAVAERAVTLRSGLRLKLPDASILATSQIAGLPLCTRNTRDFPEDDPAIRVPYRL